MLIGLLFAITACNDTFTANQQDKVQLKVPDFEKPIIKYGSLAFNSGKDLKGLLFNLQKQPADKLNKYMNKQVAGFTSLRQAKSKIKQNKVSSKAVAKVLGLKIPDPNFASILNKNGVFQVEETVYKVTNKYTYIFKNRVAFESFDFPNMSADKSKPYQSYIQPCQTFENGNRVAKLQSDVYRATNCGGGGGSSGGNSDDDDETPPDELEPYHNIEVDYAKERHKYYRSGGTEGRLKGKTWDVNYFVYSSVGTKTKHERKTWGRWWDRTADKITLEAVGSYNYGKQKVDYSYLKTTLKFDYGSYLKEQGLIDAFLGDILGMDSNSTISETFTDLVSGQSVGITVFKHEFNEGYNITWFPTAVYYNHSKSDAKRIKKIFDWSTAIFSYPPVGIQKPAVDFKIEIIRAVHTLKHDGYHLGLITDIRGGNF